MENQQVSPKRGVLSSSWANRILILGVAGILFLTLYPFRIDFHTPAGIRYPFLLGKSLKTAGFYDAFLNLLLFTPFGFGLAEKLRERGKSRIFTVFVALIAGACISYAIEFLQIYIPERDSGWEDVFTNSSGAVVGGLLFETFGASVLTALSALEDAFDACLSGWRTAIALVLYFGLWFAASIPLQHEARLTNWHTADLLTIGNDASGKNPWAGGIQLVQIWDRPVLKAEASTMFTAATAAPGSTGLVVSYDFSTPKPSGDAVSLPFDLLWTPKPPAHPATNSLVLDGSSWLSTRAAVPMLVQDLQKTNQFAIRIVCTPAKANGPDARILSISEPSGPSNLNVRQDGTALVFWFRSGISMKKSQLSSHVPDVFKNGETRDILYSYDGSSLSLYVDGKPQLIRYKLGPGVALATMVGHRVKSAELTGYNYIYYALVFFPAGAFIGIATRQLARRRFAVCLIFGVVILVAPTLLELLLVSISGRSFAALHLPISIALLLGGILWINVDRLSPRRAP